MEESVSRENHSIVAVLHEPADAVLGVAGRVQSFHRDTSELETLPVAWRLRDGLAILPPDDCEARHPEFGELLSRLVELE